MDYKDSGVDIDAATHAISDVRAAIASTWGEEVASEVGSFGGLYRQPDGSYLVSSIDGVGTKLLVALAADKVEGVGADLVNHCVNDILVQGATPLFFLDYFATGKLDPAIFGRVLRGMAKACAENGCALIGGETAEMPGLYGERHFDLAGCIIGRVSADDLITGRGIREGHRLYAWPSTGLHTNGYSLARRVLMEGSGRLPLGEAPGALGVPLSDALLAVHRSYLAPVLSLRRVAKVHGLCHITGGGFIDNIPRILPSPLTAEIEADAWEVPPIFRLLQERGEISTAEMRRVFNCGIGMIAVAEEIPAAVLRKLPDPPLPIGRIVARGQGAAVRFVRQHRGLRPE